MFCAIRSSECRLSIGIQVDISSVGANFFGRTLSFLYIKYSLCYQLGTVSCLIQNLVWVVHCIVRPLCRSSDGSSVSPYVIWTVSSFTRLPFDGSYYRPQRSCGKVIFSRVSGILSKWGGGGWGCLPDTPGRTPPGRHLPADTPLGRHPRPPDPDGYCSGRYASYCSTGMHSCMVLSLYLIWDLVLKTLSSQRRYINLIVYLLCDNLLFAVNGISIMLSLHQSGSPLLLWPKFFASTWPLNKGSTDTFN